MDEHLRSIEIWNKRLIDWVVAPILMMMLIGGIVAVGMLAMAM